MPAFSTFASTGPLSPVGRWPNPLDFAYVAWSCCNASRKFDFSSDALLSLYSIRRVFLSTTAPMFIKCRRRVHN